MDYVNVFIIKYCHLYSIFFINKHLRKILKLGTYSKIKLQIASSYASLNAGLDLSTLAKRVIINTKINVLGIGIAYSSRYKDSYLSTGSRSFVLRSGKLSKDDETARNCGATVSQETIPCVNMKRGRSRRGGARARHVAMVRDQATCMRPMTTRAPRRSRRAVVSPSADSPRSGRAPAAPSSVLAERERSSNPGTCCGARTNATCTRHSLLFTNIALISQTFCKLRRTRKR